MNTPLDLYTDEELQAEIERHKVSAKVADKPTLVLKGTVCVDLVEACQDYIDFRYSDESNDDEASDYENAIFEAALETFYGKDVFEKLNALVK